MSPKIDRIAFLGHIIILFSHLIPGEIANAVRARVHQKSMRSGQKVAFFVKNEPIFLEN